MSARVEELRQALAQGCAKVGPLIEELVLALAPPADHEPDVREAMGLLRSHRCFAALDKLAAALAEECPPGSLSFFIRRQLAQAKVDRGRLEEALGVLNPLWNEVQAGGSRKDRSEVAGLIGRAHKQQFVNAFNDGEAGAAELRAAIASHASVFDLDPSWHGANLVALSARAERLGIDIADTAEVWARRLLQDLDDRGRTAWGPWDFAAAGEAWLGLRDHERSAEYFRNYWSSPNVDAFALGGTARQLREIWQAGSDPLLSPLLLQFEARSLGRPGGSVEWSPGDLSERAAGIDRDLADKNRAEALFGRGSTIPLERLLQLISHAGSICRIYDRRKPDAGGATGFLVDGALFGLPAGPVLLTNHHVLHGCEADDALLATPDYGGCIPLDHAEVRFTYWGGRKVERTFALEKILNHSPRPDIDFTLASLAETVSPEMALPICTDAKPLRSRNVVDARQRSKVLVVGHPRGEALTFSLDDTEVVDHELDGNPCAGPRRIHYRTSTDRGNSGSPVFESDTLEVVGLHRSGRVAPLRPEWPRKRPDEVYEANEAVWIGSISEYVRKSK